jgi:catalase
MQLDPGKGTVNFEPSTLDGGAPKEAPAVPAFRQRLDGEVTRHKISLTNDFEQAGERYRTLDKVDRDHLVDNIVDSLGKANKEIQQRMVANLTKADAQFGKRVAEGLKL